MPGSCTSCKYYEVTLDKKELNSDQHNIYFKFCLKQETVTESSFSVRVVSLTVTIPPNFHWAMSTVTNDT